MSRGNDPRLRLFVALINAWFSENTVHSIRVIYLPLLSVGRAPFFGPHLPDTILPECFEFVNLFVHRNIIFIHFFLILPVFFRVPDLHPSLLPSPASIFLFFSA